ncbi:hypothetical protein L195_g045402 [Trifolium pratense]|uniref:Uncharacterized protein n=1 Tax=Trifolium pratense TaxID=57577 RepID=A0A2K3MER8_TRIPR|nr:hypothetical protein L195_g045402 [Trifolium pratense]
MVPTFSVFQQIYEKNPPVNRPTVSYHAPQPFSILGPGIVGGLFLPILGALPDAMLILGVKIDSRRVELILICLDDVVRDN